MSNEIAPDRLPVDMNYPVDPAKVKGLGCRRLLYSLFIFGLVWLLGCSIYYEGLRKTFIYFSWITLPILFLIRYRHRHPLNRFSFWILLGVGCIYLWLNFAGSYSFTRDIILTITCIGVTLALAALTSKYQNRKISDSRQIAWQVQFFFFFIFSAWISCSLMDILSVGGPKTVPNPQRFETLQYEAAWKSQHIGLALSGGGYRAALMHAGILSALERNRIPISNISSVSGGSIVGAFYATGGAPVALREVMVNQELNLRRDLSDFHNALRLLGPLRIPHTRIKLLPFVEFNRTDVQANLLDRVLLHGLRFSELNNGRSPRLLIGVTDLLEGASLGLCIDGVIKRDVIRPTEKDDFVNLRNYPQVSAPRLAIGSGADAPCQRNPDESPCSQKISRLVSASGAFPLAFNAELWEPFPGEKYLMADGGITDNSAVNLLLDARETGHPQWQVDLILSSDASAFFEQTKEVEPLLEFSRAIDTVYANVGVRRQRSESRRPPIIFLSPAIFFPSTWNRGDSHTSADQSSVTNNFLLPYLSYKSLYEADNLDDLDLLIESLPDDPESHEKENAKQALGCLRGVSECKPKALNRVPTSDEYFPDEVGGMEIIESHDTLARIFLNDLKNCVEVFRQTSTLDDRISQVNAEALFRLGQYLVVFNWPVIKQQLDNVNEAKKQEGMDPGDRLGYMFDKQHKPLGQRIIDANALLNQTPLQSTLLERIKGAPYSIDTPVQANEKLYHSIEVSKGELTYSTTLGVPRRVRIKLRDIDVNRISTGDKAIILPCREDKPNCAIAQGRVLLSGNERLQENAVNQLEISLQGSGSNAGGLLSNELAHIIIEYRD